MSAQSDSTGSAEHASRESHREGSLAGRRSGPTQLVEPVTGLAIRWPHQVPEHPSISVANQRDPGSLRGANDPRSRATSGHIQPQLRPHHGRQHLTPAMAITQGHLSHSAESPPAAPIAIRALLPAPER
jgi:hypothetical protein